MVTAFASVPIARPSRARNRLRFFAAQERRGRTNAQATKTRVEGMVTAFASLADILSRCRHAIDLRFFPRESGAVAQTLERREHPVEVVRQLRASGATSTTKGDGAQPNRLGSILLPSAGDGVTRIVSGRCTSAFAGADSGFG
jgi:HAMP domain-containing protein